MSNLTYLAGCGGVTLATVVMLSAYLNAPLHTWRALRHQTLTLSIVMLSLSLGPSASPFIDVLRPIICAWVIHSTLHIHHGKGGRHHAPE